MEKTKEELFEELSAMEEKNSKKINRLMSNYAKELENSKSIYQRKIERLQSELNDALPNIHGFHKFDLFYFKEQWISDGLFAIAKKDKMKFDKYQLGVQIYDLPVELKVDNFYVILLAIFNLKRELANFGLISNTYQKIQTFHTGNTSICLGNNEQPLKVVDYNNPATIVEAFEGIKETLRVVNPASFMNTSEPRNERLQKIYGFTVKKYKEYRKESGDENCSHCGEFLDNCECDTCDDCEHVYDECDCHFCEECSNRTSSQSGYDTCHCERCGSCEELMGNCDCERCERCKLLTDDCYCDWCRVCSTFADLCKNPTGEGHTFKSPKTENVIENTN